MEQVSMNAKPIEVEGNTPVAVDMPVAVDSPTPDVYLEGIEVYKDIIAKLKTKLADLIKEGLMSEAVANRIADEFSYNAFQQAVKVKYE